MFLTVERGENLAVRNKPGLSSEEKNLILILAFEVIVRTILQLLAHCGIYLIRF